MEVVTEYPIPGGRIDAVWLLPLPESIPGWDERLPIAGFEIESSWRTRKHVKGDLLNLQDLGASLGIIVLLGDDPEVVALRQFAQQLVDRPQGRVLIWSDAEVEALARGSVKTIEQMPAPSTTHTPTTGRSEDKHLQPVGEVNHSGKYRPLWRWLTNQSTGQVEMSFGEIEAILGFKLPPSCYRHPAHWHSYEGSAVVRAITDAGWRARRVDLTNQRVTLVRDTREANDRTGEI